MDLTNKSLSAISEAVRNDNTIVADNTPLEIGDYVIVLRASHGWGDISRGDIGKVISGRRGGDLFDVDFGEGKHRDWTGDRSCFLKIFGSSIDEIVQESEKRANEHIKKCIKEAKEDGGSVNVYIRITCHTLRPGGVGKEFELKIPANDFSRIRTMKGFKRKLEELVPKHLGEYIHPSRVERVRNVFVFGSKVESFKFNTAVEGEPQYV